MVVLYKNRKVEIQDTQFELGEGVYVLSAVWVDTGIELTERELEKVESACQLELYRNIYSGLADAARGAREDR